MTIDELKAVPFYFVCSMALENEHAVTYESEDGRLGYCDHTPKKGYGDFGRSYRHWKIDGKVYKTKEKFITALADFNPAVVPINLPHYQNVMARMKHEQDAKPSAVFVDLHPKDNEE